MSLISDVDITDSVAYFKNSFALDPEGLHQFSVNPNLPYCAGPRIMTGGQIYYYEDVLGHGRMVKHHPFKPLVTVHHEGRLKVFLKSSASYEEQIELFPPLRRSEALNFALYSAPLKVTRLFSGQTWEVRFASANWSSDYDPNYREECADSCKSAISCYDMSM